MIKRARNSIILILLICLMTGCVKCNVNMDIKKDKSMNFAVIYAVDTKLLGDDQLLSSGDKQALIDRGFIITDYDKDNMKGLKLSKAIKNIDTLSSTKYKKYNLLAENKDNYMFKVKKGFIKNKYTAHFVFDEPNTNNTTDVSSDEHITGVESDTSLADIDKYSAQYQLDLKVNVNLPYSAISSNASDTKNNKKSLIWNLVDNKNQSIDFEFELYNMTNIYISIGIALLLIIMIILGFIKKIKTKIEDKKSKDKDDAHLLGTLPLLNTEMNDKSEKFLSDQENVARINNSINSFEEINEERAFNKPRTGSSVNQQSIIDFQSNGIQAPTSSNVNTRTYDGTPKSLLKDVLMEDSNKIPEIIPDNVNSPNNKKD